MTTVSRTSRDDETAQLIATIETGVANLVTSDDWTAALRFAATFHRYSFGNWMLIAAQNPDATAVAGYRAWQAKGRQVRKGEHAIAILAPVVRKVDDDNTGEKVRRVVAFRAARVFDVGQTDGDSIPEPPSPVLLTGDAPAGAVDGITAAIEAAGYTVNPASRTGDDGLGSANGLTDYVYKAVAYADDLSPAATVKTLAHEYAHVDLHRPDVRPDGLARSRAEVEAESVAYVVATRLGLDSTGYSFPYVASWSGGDTAAVHASAQRITATAHKLLDALTADDESEEVAA